MDDNGLADPFLKFHLVDTVTKREVAKFTTAVYKERLSVKFEGPNEEIVLLQFDQTNLDRFVFLVNLFDWDQTSNEYIGQMMMPLKDVVQQTETAEAVQNHGIVQQWIELPDTDFFPKFHHTSFFSQLKAYKRKVQKNINKELSFRKKAQQPEKEQVQENTEMENRKVVGNVSVTVREGRGIQGSQTRYYVEMCVEDGCKHTKIVENIRGTVRFYETKSFAVTDVTGDVVLSVYDSSDVLLGYVMVPMYSLVTPFGLKQPEVQWFELFPPMEKVPYSSPSLCVSTCHPLLLVH